MLVLCNIVSYRIAAPKETISLFRLVGLIVLNQRRRALSVSLFKRLNHEKIGGKALGRNAELVH